MRLDVRWYHRLGPSPWFLVLAALVARPASSDTSCFDCLDDDGDTLVDCHDPDCWSDPACADVYLSQRLERPVCGPPIQPREIWRISGNAYDVPLVGDIDGDGVTELVMTMGLDPTRVVILDGRTGETERDEAVLVTNPNRMEAAIADVDGDGTAEIFLAETYDQTGNAYLARLEHDLSFTWEVGTPATGSLVTSFEPVGPSFADFDHDGEPEVYQLGLIRSARDGALLVDLETDLNFDTTMHSLAADVFPDAACASCTGLELVESSRVWAVDVTAGTYELVASAPLTRRGTLALVDWNGDAALDVVTNTTLFRRPDNSYPLTDIDLYVWDPRSATALSPSYVPTALARNDMSTSTPAVADFDGDTLLEIAVLGDVDGVGAMRVHDDDMSVQWQWTPGENSHWTSATGYDFDADGVPEIVARGGTHLRILSGIDGSVLFERSCSSLTSTERPVIADINGDGQAEIVTGCGLSSLVAYTVDDSPPCRRVMNQFHLDVVNVEDDLTIPCRLQGKAADGLHESLNANLIQAPLFHQGLSPADLCTCSALPFAAVPEPVVAGCAGGSFLLDGSASAGPDCSAGLVHQWTDAEDAVVCDWSASPTCLVPAEAEESFTLTVACAGDLDCCVSVTVDTMLIDGPVPSAGEPAEACPGVEVLLTGARSLPGDCAELLYRWSDETGVVRDFDPDPTLLVQVDVDTTYTLDVTCAGAPGCLVSDTVEVTVGSPPPVPAFGQALRATDGTETSVTFEWSLARPAEAYEHYHVYRSERPDGGFILQPPEHDLVVPWWTDRVAPDALYFYDVRFATCVEVVSESPYRGLP